jgi:hypothetical protein
VSWRFEISEPTLPEYQFDERERTLWGALQTQSKRALWRKGRWGKPPKRTMPRYDLVERLQGELGWSLNEVHNVWVRAKAKCQKERKAIEG